MTFEGLMDYAQRHMAAQEWMLAADRFHEAHRVDSVSPLPRAGLGRIALIMGRMAEGISLLDAVLAEHPTCVEALIARAMADDDEGRTLEAVELYERALELAPEHSEALAGLGLAMARLGRWRQSRHFLKKALATMSEPEILSAYAVASFQDGDVREGIGVLCHSIARNPNHVDSIAALSDMLVAVGQKGTAAQLLDNSLVRTADTSLRARRRALA